MSSIYIYMCYSISINILLLIHVVILLQYINNVLVQYSDEEMEHEAVKTK